jgi:transcriptional regulator with XRE-family HTH domain
MNKTDMAEHIRQAVLKAGSQSAFARQCNVTRSYIHDLIQGRRDPGPKILDILGIEKVVTVSYRLKDDDHAHPDDQ